MRITALFLIPIILSGCMVGPNYKTPITPIPPAYIENQPAVYECVDDEALVHWWRIFNDPFLDQLLEEALYRNFDYHIALERVKQARAQYWVQFTQILPEFDGVFTASRFRTSQSFANSGNINGNQIVNNNTVTNLSPIRDFFLFGFDAIWELDLFGKLRRSARSSLYTWQATVEEARDVKIIMLSEIAKTYATIAALQKKIDILQQTVFLDRDALHMASERFGSGLANFQENETLRATLEADEATLNVNEILLKLNIYSLGVLLGRPPETFYGDFLIAHPIPISTEKIPVGLPGDLLRRRPDIRSAERQLAAATEQIGVAVADLYPSISLSGSSSSFAANPLQGANIGYSSDRLNKLFTPSSRIWGIGATVTWPGIDFGKRLASVDVEVALQHQAYLTYQKAVVNAIQETEQALAAYHNEEQRQFHLISQTQANRKILDLTTDMYQSGLADYSQVIQAKETWLSSLSTLTDSQQALATDLIAVYKALGGDW